MGKQNILRLPWLPNSLNIKEQIASGSIHCKVSCPRGSNKVLSPNVPFFLRNFQWAGNYHIYYQYVQWQELIQTHGSLVFLLCLSLHFASNDFRLAAFFFCSYKFSGGFAPALLSSESSSFKLVVRSQHFEKGCQNRMTVYYNHLDGSVSYHTLGLLAQL